MLPQGQRQDLLSLEQKCTIVHPHNYQRICSQVHELPSDDYAPTSLTESIGAVTAGGFIAVRG